MVDQLKGNTLLVVSDPIAFDVPVGSTSDDFIEIALQSGARNGRLGTVKLITKYTGGVLSVASIVVAGVQYKYDPNYGYALGGKDNELALDTSFGVAAFFFPVGTVASGLYFGFYKPGVKSTYEFNTPYEERIGRGDSRYNNSRFRNRGSK